MKRGDLKNGDVFRYANEDYGVARHIGFRHRDTPIPSVLSNDHGIDADLTAEVVLLWRPPKPARSNLEKFHRMNHIVNLTKELMGFQSNEGLSTATLVAKAREIVSEIEQQEEAESP